ncbi:MAG: hypothetical protein C4314_06825, partial [Thermoflexus sp.]
MSPASMAVAAWSLPTGGSRLAAGILLGVWLAAGATLLLHDAFYTRLDVAGAQQISPEALAEA